MKYTVKDGNETLQLNGTLLASSSSYEAGKPRWVEFQLFRTNGGQYVISRIGYSLYFHADQCALVTRNRLSPVHESELLVAAIPCEKCKPSRIDVRGVYPERPRYYASVSEKPSGVVDSLTQRDTNTSKYLTNVAKSLLAAASLEDEDIREAFSVRVVD